MNKTQIGDYSEQLFVLYCLKNEIPICKPIGNNLPYDFVIEYNGTLLKMQVKTAYHMESQSEMVYSFNTRSCSKNYSEITTSDYIGKIDYFVVINQDFPEKICFVPADKASKSMMNLYYGETPRANQKSYKSYLNIQ